MVARKLETAAQAIESAGRITPRLRASLETNSALLRKLERTAFAEQPK